MKISDVPRPRGARARRKRRIGRGPGSGHGKTATRGHKGAQSRTGAKRRPGFEGGQMPLIRRVPKRGFIHAQRVEFSEVNVGRLSVFAANTDVTPDALRTARLVRTAHAPIKLLGDGDVASPLRITVHRCSQRARAKVEAAGGTVTLIPIAAPAGRRTG